MSNLIRPSQHYYFFSGFILENMVEKEKDTSDSGNDFEAKTQLDKVAKLLMKYKKLEFEIQGHVCCTPPYQKEAIDLATRKRNLSQNRAESVFKYLSFKKIAKARISCSERSEKRRRLDRPAIMEPPLE